MKKYLYRSLFWLVCHLGRPIGGIRPRRIYQWLARRAFRSPEFRWHRNKWGCELLLSPSYHLDCEVIAFGTYDNEVHQYLDRALRPGMICMDVGANIGEIGMHIARKVSPGGYVHSFEPAPPLLTRLVQNIERNGLGAVMRAWPIALSDRTGMAMFGFADPGKNNQGMGSLVNRRNEVVQLEGEVPTLALDDFVRQENITRVDLMKIDIQGAEWLLLQGGKKFFSEIGPDLLVEISASDLYYLGRTGKDLCVLIESFGYELYELSGGTPRKRINTMEMPLDFSAENLLATKRTV